MKKDSGSKFNDTLAIIVLYNQSLFESKTYKSLNNILVGLNECIDLVVYDNSIQSNYSRNVRSDHFNITYLHNPLNPGIAIAYNYALNIAIEKQFKWLLLLDQDTTITIEYIEELLICKVKSELESVSAIIPVVVSLNDKRRISPTRNLLGGIRRPFNTYGLNIGMPISAINSGSLLRVEYLSSIGGFSLKYTLDMLDHWYYRKMNNDRKSIFILKSLIYQELSVFNNFEEHVSPVRYKNMLASENTFMKDENFVNRFIFKLRLVLRLIKQIGFNDKSYFKITLTNILDNKVH